MLTTTAAPFCGRGSQRSATAHIHNTFHWQSNTNIFKLMIEGDRLIRDMINWLVCLSLKSADLTDHVVLCCTNMPSMEIKFSFTPLPVMCLYKPHRIMPVCSRFSCMEQRTLSLIRKPHCSLKSLKTWTHPRIAPTWTSFTAYSKARKTTVPLSLHKPCSLHPPVPGNKTPE